MLNSVDLIGRLAHTPIQKVFDNGNKISNITIAITRDYKNQNDEYEADFINCTCSNQLSDLIQKYFDKGSLIGLHGKIKTRKYQDKNGNNRIAFEIEVKEITFLEKKKDAVKSFSSGTADKNSVEDFANFEDISTEEELPF